MQGNAINSTLLLNKAFLTAVFTGKAEAVEFLGIGISLIEAKGVITPFIFMGKIQAIFCCFSCR